jgi:hypothetical protein
VTVVLVVSAVGSRLDVVVLGSDTVGKLMGMLVGGVLMFLMLLAKASPKEAMKTLQTIA